MKGYGEKERRDTREGKEVRALKRFFGALLFFLAIFFREILTKLPGYAGMILALVYLLIQYWLWIGGGNGNEKREPLKNR